MPSLYQQLVSKNRSAWAVRTCLSTKKRPETIRFSLGGSSDETQAGILADGATGVGETVEMQCIPIYSLLLALGNPTVDFLSLDIEGAEFQVLRTIPWDKVDIRALSVETQFAGDVMEGSRRDIFDLLLGVGFSHLGSLARDDIFVRLSDGGKSQRIGFSEVARRPMPRLCEFSRVPKEKLADHCRINYPRYHPWMDFLTHQTPFLRDFMAHHPPDAASLPCLSNTLCSWTLEALVSTLSFKIHWKTVLSDNCLVLQQGTVVASIDLQGNPLWQDGLRKLQRK